MHHGYFDESGDLGRSPGVFCISGYFLTADAALAMAEQWNAVLNEHSIPIFHMVDCAHGTGVFANRRKNDRIEIATRLIELIKTYTLQGFSIVAHAEAFEPSGSDDPDVYSNCAQMAVGALRVFLKTNRIDGSIRCFFESGHQSAGRAYNRLASRLTELAAAVEFSEKTQVRLLQAADLLAWQTTKYVKDRLSQARNPRQDFLSLMEHSHMFVYLTLKDGQKSMAVETWPLSSRSAATTQLAVDDSGPIALLREDGENIPIIPISRTLGWRMGGGRMAYLAFQDLADNDFYLAFDEPRLAEALLNLLAATNVFGGGVAAISVAGLALESVQGEDVLRVTLLNGPDVILSVSKEALTSFRNAVADV